MNGSDSPLKDISFKYIMILMILSNLLVHKPSKTSKSKESSEQSLSVQNPSTIAEISRKFKQRSWRKATSTLH